MIASEDYKGASAKVSALEPELEAARQAAEEAEAEADALEAARAAALAEEEAASRRAKAYAAESIARAKELRESSEANNILLNECAEKIYRIGRDHEDLSKQYKEKLATKKKSAEDITDNAMFDAGMAAKREQTLLNDIRLLEQENTNLLKDKDRLRAEIENLQASIQADIPQARRTV